MGDGYRDNVVALEGFIKQMGYTLMIPPKHIMVPHLLIVGIILKLS